MKRVLLFFLLPLALPVAAQVDLHLSSATRGGSEVVLYRYDDPFTRRTVRLTGTRFDSSGHALLRADIQQRTKAFIALGDGGLDLFLDPGKTYSITLEDVGGAGARSLSTTARTPFVLNDLDPLDINALVSDLNERLDAFLAEDLATDAVAGMQAVRVVKQKGPANDTVPRRPPTLFVVPDLSDARVDTFEQKLRRFYADVEDPWFQRHVELAVADLRVGPRTNNGALYDRYLKGHPPATDDAQYVMLLRNIFGESLRSRLHQQQPMVVKRVIAKAKIDSLQLLFAEDDRLEGDAATRELVMLDELYREFHSGLFDRKGIRSILEQASKEGSSEATRKIAANMVLDLTSMGIGDVLPAMDLALDQGMHLDSILKGPVYMMTLASWCTYCEQQLVALEALASEYHPYFTFLVVGTDADQADWHRFVEGRAPSPIVWAWAKDRSRAMEDLRIRSVPAYFLLNGDRIARNPAPAPSEGLAAILHKARTQAQEEKKIKFGDGEAPPRR